MAKPIEEYLLNDNRRHFFLMSIIDTLQNDDIKDDKKEVYRNILTVQRELKYLSKHLNQLLDVIYKKLQDNSSINKKYKDRLIRTRQVIGLELSMLDSIICFNKIKVQDYIRYKHNELSTLTLTESFAGYKTMLQTEKILHNTNYNLIGI